MRLILNLFIIFTSAFCFSSQNEISFELNDVSLEHLIAENTICVKKITDNQIYLKEECILITEQGILLKLNDCGDLARIPTLSSDALGCYINFSVVAVEVRKICPGCGKPYFIYCRNPDCPLKKRNN